MIEHGIVHLGRFFLELELILLIALVLMAAWFDFAARRIPNWLIGIGFVISLVYQTISGYGTGFSSWAAGLGVGFALFFPMYMLRAMGAGDVKLMAMVGSFFGGIAALNAGLLTLVAGGALALLYMLRMKRLKIVFENISLMLVNMAISVTLKKMPTAQLSAQSAGSMPYAIAIAAGTLLYIFVVRA